MNTVTKILSALTLTLVGCTGMGGELDKVCTDRGQDPVECAEAQWSNEGLAPGQAPRKLSDDCRATVEASTFRTIDVGSIDAKCGAEYSGPRTAGCVLHYSANGADIALSNTEDGQSADTAAHELLHVILQCESSGPSNPGDHDAAHRKSVWGALK